MHQLDEAAGIIFHADADVSYSTIVNLVASAVPEGARTSSTLGGISFADSCAHVVPALGTRVSLSCGDRGADTVLRGAFDAFDVDGDGRLSTREIGAALASFRKLPSAAARPSRSGAASAVGAEVDRCDASGQSRPASAAVVVDVHEVTGVKTRSRPANAVCEAKTETTSCLMLGWGADVSAAAAATRRRGNVAVRVLPRLRDGPPARRERKADAGTEGR